MSFLSFLVAVGYLPGSFGASTTLRWWMIFVGGFICLAIELWKNKERQHLTMGHWLGLLFLGCSALSGAWAISAYDVADEGLKLIGLSAVFCYASMTRESLDKCWLGLGYGLAVNGVLCVMQYLGVALANPLGMTAPGLFLNSDLLGEFAAPVFIALGMSSLYVNRRDWRWLMLAAAIPLVLTASRSAWLGVIACAVYLTWSCVSRKGRVYLALTVTTILAVFFLFEWHSPSRAGSMSNRLEFWAWTISNLSWFGWGLGNYGTVFAWEHAHNELLEWAFELGLLSLALWGLIVYAFIKGQYVLEKLVLLSILVEAMFYFPLHDPATCFITALCLGRLCRHHTGSYPAYSRVSRITGLA